MTKLRLQKLVYYAQGLALAILGRPLFGEALMAWQSGPVVPELYFKYPSYGAKRLPASKDRDDEKLSDDDQALLDDVYAACGQFAAWKLASKVRAEAMAAVRVEMTRADDAMGKAAERGIARVEPIGVIENSDVLEFLGLSEQPASSEGDWKTRVCDRLKANLLKQDRGFAFAGRTLRNAGGEDDVAALVFFNRFVRCFVLFDVKTGEITPQDIDQFWRCISGCD